MLQRQTTHHEKNKAFEDGADLTPAAEILEERGQAKSSKDLYRIFQCQRTRQ
jgi:hypothetical protein